MRGMMRTSVAAALVLVAAAVLAGPGWTAEGEHKIRFAGNLPAENSNSKAMVVFKEELERLTNKRILVDVFPGMTLGGAKENVDMTRTGSIAATYVGLAFLTGFVPKLNVLNLPFLWKDRETAFRVLEGAIGKELEQDLDKAGFKLIGFWENGWRHFTNRKRAIQLPDDLKGLKIRVQPGEVYLKTMRALGANPVAMDIKEVYSALQQGVVDGQENPFANILNLRFYEVQKYLTAAGYVYDLMGAVMNKRFYDGLPPDLKAAVDQAAKSATGFQRKQAAEDDGKAMEALKKAGMQIHFPDVREVAQFRQRVKPVYEDFEKTYGREIIQGLVAANQ